MWERRIWVVVTGVWLVVFALMWVVEPGGPAIIVLGLWLMAMVPVVGHSPFRRPWSRTRQNMFRVWRVPSLVLGAGIACLGLVLTLRA